MKRLICSLCISFTIIPVAQAANHQAMEHGMPAEERTQETRKGDHAGHPMTPAVADGVWSYRQREKPEPFRERRWEMIPVPGYGSMFLNTEKLNRGLICDTLKDNPRIMVDRAKRKECGMPEVPMPAAPLPSERPGELKKGEKQPEHHEMPMHHEAPRQH